MYKKMPVLPTELVKQGVDIPSKSLGIDDAGRGITCRNGRCFQVFRHRGREETEPLLAIEQGDVAVDGQAIDDRIHILEKLRNLHLTHKPHHRSANHLPQEN